MGPFDALWHALNFFAPALGMAVLAASAAKLLWRRDLAAVSWYRLALWGALAGMAALAGGLALFGRDGEPPDLLRRDDRGRPPRVADAVLHTELHAL